MADATDAKEKEVEKTRKREASMQDESTKTQYEGLNPGELKGSRSQRKEARERRERREADAAEANSNDFGACVLGSGRSRDGGAVVTTNRLHAV